MKPADIALVLFDIDGTLLDIKGAGRVAFIRTIEEVMGWEDDLAYVNFAGATDLDVLRKVVERQGGVCTTDIEKRFFNRLPVELEQTVADAEPRMYPGVKELLETLTADPRVLVGIVTGNVESCARIKLRSLDLHDHFVLGAFGHEHADRDRLAQLALDRARRRLRHDEVLARRFLVGDTPADVAAARTIDAFSIAVATGFYGEDALREAVADCVVNDLADTAAILRVLGLSLPPAPTPPV